MSCIFNFYIFLTTRSIYRHSARVLIALVFAFLNYCGARDFLVVTYEQQLWTPQVRSESLAERHGFLLELSSGCFAGLAVIGNVQEICARYHGSCKECVHALVNEASWSWLAKSAHSERRLALVERNKPGCREQDLYSLVWAYNLDLLIQVSWNRPQVKKRHLQNSRVNRQTHDSGWDDDCQSW